MKGFLLTALIAAVALMTPAHAGGKLSGGSGQYACIALSTNGKPAWGAQSKMKDSAICLKDALRFCKEHHVKKGEDGKCAAKFADAWILGLRCGSGKSVKLFISEGDEDPADAANTLLEQAGSNLVERCDFLALRHASDYGKAEDASWQWTAKASCGGRVETVTMVGGASALNAVLLLNGQYNECGRCKVLSLKSH